MINGRLGGRFKALNLNGISENFIYFLKFHLENNYIWKCVGGRLEDKILDSLANSLEEWFMSPQFLRNCWLAMRLKFVFLESIW